MCGLGLNFVIVSGSFHKRIQMFQIHFNALFVTDVFGTADPFGSNSFGSKGGGFADFSQMSKVSSGDSQSYESVAP